MTLWVFSRESAKDVTALPASMTLASARNALEGLRVIMIRDRDWAYSTLAYGVPAAKREELRKEIVAPYGEKLELIASKSEFLATTAWGGNSTCQKICRTGYVLDI